MMADTVGHAGAISKNRAKVHGHEIKKARGIGSPSGLGKEWTAFVTHCVGCSPSRPVGEVSLILVHGFNSVRDLLLEVVGQL